MFHYSFHIKLEHSLSFKFISYMFQFLDSKRRDGRAKSEREEPFLMAYLKLARIFPCVLPLALKIILVNT